MNKTFMMFMLSAMMLLAACSKQVATNATAEQMEGRWVLQSVQGAPLPVTENDKQPFMLYTMAENRFSCSVGCNNMGGSLTLENGKLTLSNMFSTKMLCPNEAAMELENRLGVLLDKVTTAKILDNTLTLYSEDGQPILTMTRE